MLFDFPTGALRRRDSAWQALAKEAAEILSARDISLSSSLLFGYYCLLWMSRVNILRKKLGCEIFHASAETPREIAKQVSPSVVLLVMEDSNGQQLSMGSGLEFIWPIMTWIIGT